MSDLTAIPVTLEFDHALADHLAAERLYYRSSLLWKIDKAAAVLIAAAGVFFVIALGFHWWTVIWFPLAIAEWCNLLSLRPLQIRLYFKRNPKFLERYRLTFSDAGIHFTTQSIDATIAWTHYSRIMENDVVVLLIYGSRAYTVIPKRAFADESQYAAFMALVRRHIPAGAH